MKRVFEEKKAEIGAALEKSAQDEVAKMPEKQESEGKS